MKVLALTQAANHVCYRYRIAAFDAQFAERGIEVEPLPLANGVWERLRQFRLAARFDAVILQRKLLPIWQIHLLRRAARRLFFDFDDAVFVRDSYSTKGPKSRLRMLRFRAALRASDVVTAGNAYLASRACEWVSPARVHRLPTCIDSRRYQPAVHHRTGNEARLVWIGQRSTLPSLSGAEPGLTAAAARLPGIAMHVISDVFPCLESIRVVPRAWSEASEASDLAEADIGISWLPDDVWSLGKCGLKVLQYMAAGLPVVANPVGMNAEMVVDGRTGFLAQTAEEWCDAIALLAGRPELRMRMGSAGRDRVEREYGVPRWGEEFARLLAPDIRHDGPHIAGHPVADNLASARRLAGRQP